MTDQDAKVPRRGFLKIINSLLAALGLGAILGPAIAYFWPSELEEMPSEPVPAGTEDSIAVGESTTIRFGRYPALIINTPERGLVAYSAVCTHFACLVKWNPEINMVECPCHEGYFSAVDGSVISGPPPTPLEELIVRIDNGIILIGGEA
jgi:cytochrome b6-f complex iron-sulfur subunit